MSVRRRGFLGLLAAAGAALVAVGRRRGPDPARARTLHPEERPVIPVKPLDEAAGIGPSDLAG